MRNRALVISLLLVSAAPAAAQEVLDCAALANSAGAEPANYAEQCAPEVVERAPLSPLAPHAPSDTGYSYNMRGVAGSNQGLYTFTLNAFATQTFVGDPGGQFYSWDFDPTAATLYAIQTPATPPSLFGTVNQATGVFTQLAAVTGLTGADTPTGLSIDPVTGDAFISSAANLYTFNLGTGAATLVGAFGVATGIMVDISINCDGNLYGHDIGTDSLYSINRATGAATLIGAHGLAANFAQGMDFDNNDGTLYAAVYTGSGTFTYGSFNLATGAITPLHTNTPSGEWELSIPTTCGPVVPPTETEPNDSKAEANTIQLPGTDREGVMTGNSISASTTGIDTYLVKSSSQAPGFYRHRLILTSAIAGHTMTIRGLTQATGGVITPGTDIVVQTSSAGTTPARFVQWYTSGAPADIFVRVTGTASTTADYQLNYEVDAVEPVAGPVALPPGDVTVSTLGQTTVDTDFWIYDGARTAIPGFGNDDQFGAAAAQSIITREFDPGVYYLAVTNYNFANDQASPPDDDFRTGNVLDFPGALANSSSSTVTDLDTSIGGTPVTLTRAGVYDIQFARFTVGVGEIEPNDSKAAANALLLPAADATGIFGGNSTSASTTGFDYVLATTAAQATPGFYRHRLLVTSDTVGHTLTIRGLTQSAGVINAGTDATFQTSSATSTPARFIQWYTSEQPADVYIRVTGAAGTTSDYNLDYTVEAVTPVAGPEAAANPVTITTVGQTTVDTDTWVYDASRSAIPDYGNDDHLNGETFQSELIRTYADGTYYLAISNFSFANNLPSPTDDDFRSGTVLDFPGIFANSSTTLNLALNPNIAGVPVPLIRAGAYDVAIVEFTVTGDTIFADGFD